MSNSTLPSGIRQDESGTRFVGGTVRSNGTIRKVYKVRPGYVPQEDVQKYVAPKRSRVPLTDGSANRVASPHLRTINGILAGNECSTGNKPSRAKAVLVGNSDSEFPPLRQKPTGSKPVDDVVDALSSLDISGKDKKELLTKPQCDNDSSPVVKPKSEQSNSKLEPKLNSKSSTGFAVKTISKASPTPESIENLLSKAADDTKSASGKYIPPWKRTK